MKAKSRKRVSVDEPVGALRQVTDFLPPPERLLKPESTVKVTLALDQESVRFFKRRAAKSGTRYQKMIREVIRGYAAHYS